MTTLQTTSRSLRLVRLQAALPRIVAGAVAAIVFIAGVRAIVAPVSRVTVMRRQAVAPPLDQGAEAFAQAFGQAYLTGAKSQAQAAAKLRPYIASNLNPDALTTQGTSGTVSSTAVVGEQRQAGETIVTIAAQTSAGTEYLAVPVGRDHRGLLFVAGYPAIVGPPASDSSASAPLGSTVSDTSLNTVATAAVKAYVAGDEPGLLPELAPGAVVSLPPQHLTVVNTEPAMWVVPGREVAVQVVATEEGEGSRTLSYRLTVEKRGRWYVQQLEVNPAYQGGLA